MIRILCYKYIENTQVSIIFVPQNFDRSVYTIMYASETICSLFYDVLETMNVHESCRLEIAKHW